MLSKAILIGLALIGAISPLCTASALFQRKEWRWDRLLAHLHREGWFRQIFGRARPLLIAVLLAATALLPARFPPDVTIGILAVLTALQAALRRQRLPVWTTKAISVVTLATALLGAIGFALQETPLLLLLLPLSAPFALGITVILLSPLDLLLKRRVFATAQRLRERDNGRVVIGIAGSVGKTTTKELLREALRPLGALATPDHVNTEMGVARWLTGILRGGLPSSVPLIVEMGAYRAGEVATLCRIAQPTIGILTRLGRDHLSLFGSQDAIRDANAELLDALPASGLAVLLADDPAAQHLAIRVRCPVQRVGTASDADLQATDLREEPQGLTFRVDDTLVRLALHGRHAIENALPALAVANHLQLPLVQTAHRLENVRPLSHTFTVRHERGCVLLDDTYNCSPESFTAALQWAQEREERPRILLTSGIMELGKEEDAILTEAGRTAGPIMDRVLFTADAGRAAFARGYGKDIERWSAASKRIPSGALLVCIGRMPLACIQQLLPH